MSWRGGSNKFPPTPGTSPGNSPGRTFKTPAGFRDSPDPALAIGEVISSTYTVRREIHRGDTGAVFEAWDMLVERAAVLKVAWRDPGTASLVQEARRCAAVAVHGGAAASVFGVGNHRGAEYLAGEYVEGVTARDHLRAIAATEQRPTATELVSLVLAAARALASVHQAGFAVGDLAPETVLITGEERVLFGRFSLGQVAAVGPGGACFAPEVVTGQRSAADPAAVAAIDLYGLGCLALELALGTPAFSGDTLKALMFAHVHHRPPALSEVRTDLPVELADLVAELLSKEPQARPMDAASVVEQLEIVAERAQAGKRSVRVLIVDDDGDRVRQLWSAVRRAHPRSQVDAARDGREAAAKLTRDRPDLVLIDATLGVMTPGMNALELLMYASSLDEMTTATLVVTGDAVAERDAAMLTQFGARLANGRARLADTVGRLVREVASTPRVTGARRTLVG
jgi:serine/threonine protein kinase